GFESSDAARRDKHFEFIHDLDALLVLLSTVGQSNVGLSLDVWHVWAAGGSLDAVSKKLKADQIVAVALADAAQPDATQPDATQPESGDPHDAATRLLPGETGVIDSAAALSMLADLDYDGPVTPLPDRSRFAGMRRDAIAKLAGEKLDAVWQAAGLKKGSGFRVQDSGAAANR
ncbi:MAG TPA: TIM barrel protein, partial [Pirellulales bacterium]|nr:TIM barrel protein [Pirellulales bacterium]